MTKNTLPLMLSTCLLFCFTSCNTEWRKVKREIFKESGYKLTRKDYKIIRQIKKEDAEADAITIERMKDPSYLEYIKKTNTEDSVLKKRN